MQKAAILMALLLSLTACSQPAEEASQGKIVAGSASTSSETETSSQQPEPESLPEAATQSDQEAEAASLAAEASELAASSSEAADETDQAASEAIARAVSEAAAQAALEADTKAADTPATAASSEAAVLPADQTAADEAARAASDAAALEQAMRAASEAAAKQAQEPQTASSIAQPQKSVSKVRISDKNFLSDIENEVLRLQNEERARLGLPKLQYDENLRTAARIRSKELFQADMFAHTRPDGREWYTVLQEDVPYNYKSAGENLGNAEYNDPSIHYATDAGFWVTEWINSPDHYRNMIREEYNRGAVGIYCVERDGMTYAYATTLFAYVAE